MKKITIGATGLSGLIGSRVEALTREQFEWRAFQYEDGLDITKPEDVEQWVSGLDGDVVFHLAAFTDLNAAWQQRGDTNGSCYRINVLGTRNIANACAKFSKYLIHVSTDAVFSGEKKEPYTDQDTPNPI
jgi:dTDP-4-dehydrorhamnose reductase